MVEINGKYIMCDPATIATRIFTVLVVDPYMNLNFPPLLIGRGSPNGYYMIIRIAALQKKSLTKKMKSLIKKEFD